ncbi:carboxymuconolactone decarboxylase family protein [Paraburkholderia kirstenboschensis]|uniref:carboxymuconolactone decarboxylase family protein n=1 Tax=Paraburkholderia kirstenboschensis TaxID=1245436 RepID=UPI003743B9C0
MQRLHSSPTRPFRSAQINRRPCCDKTDAAAARSGMLEPKIHELIALAVAVTTRCDGCIAVHTKRAVDKGATREEIAEALGVAIALNAGAAMTYTARCSMHTQH